MLALRDLIRYAARARLLFGGIFLDDPTPPVARIALVVCVRFLRLRT